MQLSRFKTNVYLGILVLLWGWNWPLTKYGLIFMPPLLFAGFRLLVGGVILVLIALPRLHMLRLKENWPVYALSALLNIVFYYGFQTVGLAHAPAGLFSSIVFLQPVLIGIGAWLWLGESMNAIKIVGLVLGFAGVATISIGGITGNVSAAGIALALASAISWALGTIYMKKNAARVDGLWMTATSVLAGGIVLTATGSITESWASVRWTIPFMLDTLFIALLVIALGWLLYFKLLGSGEASKVGSFTFLIPLVSILTSVLMFGESVSLNLIAGLVLILFSIVLVNRRTAGPQTAKSSAS